MSCRRLVYEIYKLTTGFQILRLPRPVAVNNPNTQLAIVYVGRKAPELVWQQTLQRVPEALQDRTIPEIIGLRRQNINRKVTRSGNAFGGGRHRPRDHHLALLE